MRVCSSLQAENVRHARKNHEKTETGANYIPRNCNFFLPFQRISFKGQNQKHDNHGLWSQERRSPDTVGGSGAWLQKCSLDIAPCVHDKWFIFLQFLSFQNINGSGSQPAFTEPRDLKKQKNRETSSNWYLIYTRGFYLVHVF